MPDLVSVIMPAYNAAKTIEQSIRSVLSQTHQEIELIIVNDCSSDETLDVINKYIEDSRVVVFSNRINSGVAKARNTAIKLAKGKYIAFLDSDDVWGKDKLERQITAMKEYGVACSHTSFLMMDNKLDKVKSKVNAQGRVSYKDMLLGNRIGNLTGIYNVQKLGKIYQKPIGHEDYQMWLDVLKQTDSVGVQESLAKYRVIESSVSSNKFKAALWHWQILQRELNNNLFKVAFYFCFYIFNAIKKRS